MPASTITRTSGSVPEGRSSTRPASPSDSEADAAAATESLGDTGRVLLRPSGTEPLVRVMVEAATVEQARAVAEELAEVVREASPPAA